MIENCFVQAYYKITKRFCEAFSRKISSINLTGWEIKQNMKRKFNYYVLIQSKELQAIF